VLYKYNRVEGNKAYGTSGYAKTDVPNFLGGFNRIWLACRQHEIEYRE
jgi:hypothetical protein